MPSSAYSRFQHKLEDVKDLLEIHTDVSGSGRGRRAQKLGVLHKSGIALLVAAWETYIESLLEEGVSFLAGQSLNTSKAGLNYAELLGMVQRLAAQASSRLNTAKSDNVLGLFRAGLGIEDIRKAWGRRGMDWTRAYKALDGLLSDRHKVVHGATTDPRFSRRDVLLWQRFLIATAERTDNAVKRRLQDLTGVAPW